ncbi:MAG: hypothetical protein MUF49_08620 [Oculatellaceae cyanobacterium Prado106]|nr:hypothetical protein [Oculatellaceae cyanobacterium Prado106]
MNKPKFFVTPGYREYMLNELHYSQAVKIGDRLGNHDYSYTAGGLDWNRMRRSSIAMVI